MVLKIRKKETFQRHMCHFYKEVPIEIRMCTAVVAPNGSQSAPAEAEERRNWGKIRAALGMQHHVSSDNFKWLENDEVNTR